MTHEIKPHKFLMTAAETAESLSVCPKTLYSVTQPRGDLPCVRIGARVLYDPRDVTAWIDSRKENGGPTMNIEPHRPRTKILVLLHSDGYVEVFAEQHVDIHLVVVPHTPVGAAEEVAQQYVELTIPHCYRSLYCPGFRRAVGQVEKLTPSDIEHRQWRKTLHQELQKLNLTEEIQKNNMEDRRVWIV